MSANLNGQGQTPSQRPLVVVTEYHSAGAIVTDDTVVTQYSSVYLASGVAADEIFGIADMQKPGASFVRLAERLAVAEAEALARSMAECLTRYRVSVEIAGMYDE